MQLAEGRAMSDKPTVAEAVANVMGAVQAIGKNQRVDTGPARFNFRGVDDVVAAVGPALRKHDVVFAPVRVVSVDHERYETSKGSSMDGVTVVVEYEFTGPAGDKLRVAAAGQAADSGDKAVPKAMSVAYRTALLEALCVPTNEPDPDSSVHERAAAPRPTVDERPYIREQIATVGKQKFGWTPQQITDDFVPWSQGQVISEADADTLTRYLTHLKTKEAS